MEGTPALMDAPVYAVEETPLATLLLLLPTPSRWRAGEKTEGMVEKEEVEKAPGDEGGKRPAGAESEEDVGAVGRREG